MANFDRCDAFWARRETDRPLLSCLVCADTLGKNFRHGVECIPDGLVQPGDIKLDAFAADYEDWYAKQQQCELDVPWVAYPLVSMPWCESILGCQIGSSGGNMAAQPWVTDYRQIQELSIAADNPWLLKLLEYQEFLVKLSNGRFPVSNSLMRGPLDLLAAVRGPQQMCLDLYDCPEDLGAALQHLTDLWIQIAHMQMRVIPPFKGGYSFGQIDLWSRKHGGWFQDDAVALWGPSAYRQHVKPCEERLAGCMDVTGKHLHPVALSSVSDLVRMRKLGVIEVNFEETPGMSLKQMIPFLRQALEHKCLIIWGEFDAADLQEIADNLPTRGLALDMIGKTPEQIQSLARDVDRIWHKRAG